MAVERERNWDSGCAMNTKHPETKCESPATAKWREIPSVDELLQRPALASLTTRMGRPLVVEATRQVLHDVRIRMAQGLHDRVSVEALELEILRASDAAAEFSLRPVINATGVILHTNLGRAPLSRRAIEHIAEVAGRYSNLEYDLDVGARGKRDVHTDRLFARWAGAERTLVVNNNAAAVYLALNTLAEAGEVIVSRGELIEIGGSFRIPEICAKSGAALREVGTTNRTRIGDYAAAVNERTRALLRVHPSNFRVVGFTERPRLDDLVALAREKHLPLIEDLGSGCLLDLAPFGIAGEPPVGESIKAGVDVVTFSGDKMLGGPQAGLLAGRKEPLDRIRKNPLFRAFRVDKLTIAALEATLLLYLEENFRAIPALRMIRLTTDEIEPRAAKLSQRIRTLPSFEAELAPGESVVGGGSTPGQSLPTRLIAVTHATLSARQLEAALRRNIPRVISRVERDRVVLDLRTVFEDQDEALALAFERLGHGENRSG